MALRDVTVPFIQPNNFPLSETHFSWSSSQINAFRTNRTATVGTSRKNSCHIFRFYISIHDPRPAATSLLSSSAVIGQSWLLPTKNSSAVIWPSCLHSYAAYITASTAVRGTRGNKCYVYSKKQHSILPV